MIAGVRQWDARSGVRDKVFYRTRARMTDGTAMAVTIVDISPRGLMVRSDAAAARGDRISIDLPIVGRVDAEVRWALGGRIGCRLARPVPAAIYTALLPVLRPG